MSEPRSKLWKHLTRETIGKAADSCMECGVFPLVDWNSEFKLHCIWHDQMYLLQEAGELPDDYDRAKVDEMFFMQCVQTSRHDPRLLEKAALYYILVRRFGGLVW